MREFITPLCRHCGKYRVSTRGICKRCRLVPAILALYPKAVRCGVPRTSNSPRCKRCKKRAVHCKGLCKLCHRIEHGEDQKRSGLREPNQAEVDALVAEGMKNKPEWWDEPDDSDPDYEPDCRPGLQNEPDDFDLDCEAEAGAGITN